MKILLLEHPRSFTVERCNDIANTPLSSCLITGYTAGILKRKGHDVEIVEGYLDRLSYDEIGRRISAMRPDILGAHLVYHWEHDHDLFSFLERIKKEAAAPRITAYGFYATIAFADILKSCSAVDSVIVGEAEIPFADLADAVSAGTQGVTIPGLAVRDGTGGVTHRKGKTVRDPDSLPFPVRTDAMYRLPEVNILGSRGCYGQCSFCYINSFYGRGEPWRGRSPENIVEEIDGIIAERGTKDFYFTDPNFFGPGRRGQERALRLSSLLKPRGIRFGIEARVNDIHEETIGALVDAGLRHILIGLESGKDESLRRMNKMTTVAQNEKALRLLRKYGVEPNVGFIMFEPDSTPEDISTNLEFLKRNNLLKHLPVTANVLYHHQIVLEGTEAYHTLMSEGRLAVCASSYEGVASFKDPGVAGLAGIMREVTKFLFTRMEGIWSGRTMEPPGAKPRYTKVNQLLIEVFEENLKSLESGGRVDDGRTAILFRRIEAEIDGIVKPTQRQTIKNGNGPQQREKV